MKAKEQMTKAMCSVRHNQNLYDAAKLMWEHDCGWLPVPDAEAQGKPDPIPRRIRT